MSHRIAILGSKAYPFVFEIETVIENMFATYQGLTFLSRGIYGVDMFAENYVDMLIKEGYPITKFICDDDETIIRETNIAIIFWDGNCKRTKKLLDLALKHHKEIYMHIRRIE